MNSLLVELVDHVESSQLVPRRLLLSNLQFSAKMAPFSMFRFYCGRCGGSPFRPSHLAPDFFGVSFALSIDLISSKK